VRGSSKPTFDEDWAMKGCTSLLVALAWVLTAGHGLAQEKYTIKLKELGKGDSSQVERKEVMSSKASVRAEKELVPKSFEFSFTKLFSYTDTILEQPEGSPLPTKVKRVYEKVVVDSQMAGLPTGGKADAAHPLSGKTLLIEKKGPLYEYRIEGGEVLDKKGTGDLNDEFIKQEQDKQTKAFLPPGPVAVNETWKFDAKDFLGDDGKGLFPDLKPEGTAKLVKVYKKDGRLYGVIDVVLDLQSKPGKKDAKAPLAMQMDMKGSIKMTLDGCIDGTFAERSLTAKMEMNGTMDIPQGGPVYSSTTASQDFTLKELPRK
jgi:hypothetical protein